MNEILIPLEQINLHTFTVQMAARLSTWLKRPLTFLYHVNFLEGMQYFKRKIASPTSKFQRIEELKKPSISQLETLCAQLEYTFPDMPRPSFKVWNGRIREVVDNSLSALHPEYIVLNREFNNPWWEYILGLRSTKVVRRGLPSVIVLPSVYEVDQITDIAYFGELRSDTRKDIVVTGKLAGKLGLPLLVNEIVTSNSLPPRFDPVKFAGKLKKKVNLPDLDYHLNLDPTKCEGMFNELPDSTLTLVNANNTSLIRTLMGQIPANIHEL